MSDRSIIVWFVAGFFLSIIDAWLSVQSIFGLINPSNFLGYAAAVTVGACLTLFAIYVPIVRASNPSPLFAALWGVAFLIDIATSVIGAIWYGVLNQPLNSRIDLSMITFAPSNWQATLIFVAFVLIVAGCCYKFGQALNALNQRYLNQRYRDSNSEPPPAQ